MRTTATVNSSEVIKVKQQTSGGGGDRSSVGHVSQARPPNESVAVTPPSRAPVRLRPRIDGMDLRPT